MNRILLGLLCLFVTSTTFSQISIIENLESGIPSGWTQTGGYTSTGVLPCEGASSVRDNLWSSSSTGSLETSNQVGASNGEDITFTYEWQTIKNHYG